jgi:hypothetical protein
MITYPLARRNKKRRRPTQCPRLCRRCTADAQRLLHLRSQALLDLASQGRPLWLCPEIARRLGLSTAELGAAAVELEQRGDVTLMPCRSGILLRVRSC